MTNIVAAFLFAVAMVEGTPHNPYGIMPSTVRDVNRLCGTQYSVRDRSCPEKAKEIIVRYIASYHHRYGPFDPCTAGRIVRGGPRGPKLRWTRDYGERVANLTRDRLGRVQ